jgi:hypothetical protein
LSPRPVARCFIVDVLLGCLHICVLLTVRFKAPAFSVCHLLTAVFAYNDRCVSNGQCGAKHMLTKKWWLKEKLLMRAVLA